MNAGMVTQEVLDKVANFKVQSLVEDTTEISLLGVEFDDVCSMPKKSFWRKYRACYKGYQSRKSSS